MSRFVQALGERLGRLDPAACASLAEDLRDRLDERRARPLAWSSRTSSSAPRR